MSKEDEWNLLKNYFKKEEIIL